MANRKFSRTSDQRNAMLRNLTTAFLWNGKIVTTEAKAKEVRSIAEKLITLAVEEYKNCDTVEKEVYTSDDKKQIMKVEKVVDRPSKLHARRMMMSYLYDVKETKQYGESKKDYAERTADRAHPVIEKLFRDYAPKYDKRGEEVGRGGYTRMYKLGPRRGDAAEMVVLELV